MHVTIGDVLVSELPLADALQAAARCCGVRAWVVGGAVRDTLLGVPIVDIDGATDGDPRTLARATAERVGLGRDPSVGLVCLDEATGTYRVVRAGHTLDLVPLPDGLEADLRRRDLTVNALACSVEGRLPQDVVDVTGGMQDLETRLLRATSRGSLEDDPVRVVRIARLAVTLGFAVESTTAAWARELAPRTVEEPGERIGQELMAMLAAPRAQAAIAEMERLRLVEVLLPELWDLRGLEQGGYHHLDAYSHSVLAFTTACAIVQGDQAAPYLQPELLDTALSEIGHTLLTGVRNRAATVLLGVLLHDIGKRRCCSVDPDGRVRFVGHEQAGEDMVARISDRLRLSRGERSILCAIARYHMRPCMLATGGTPSARAVGRLVRALGELTPDLCLASIADRLATRGPCADSEVLRSHMLAAEAVMRRWVQEKHRPAEERQLVTGDQLMQALGIEEGPLVGLLLDEIADARAAGEVQTSDEAIAMARALMGPGGLRAPI